MGSIILLAWLMIRLLLRLIDELELMNYDDECW